MSLGALCSLGINAVVMFSKKYIDFFQIFVAPTMFECIVGHVW